MRSKKNLATIKWFLPVCRSCCNGSCIQPRQKRGYNLIKRKTMAKQLLREWYEMCADGICLDLLTESEKLEVKNGAKYLTGVMQRSDTENGNGRVYGRKVLEREAENYKKIVDARRALGE